VKISIVFDNRRSFRGFFFSFFPIARYVQYPMSRACRPKLNSVWPPLSSSLLFSSWRLAATSTDIWNRRGGGAFFFSFYRGMDQEKAYGRALFPHPLLQGAQQFFTKAGLRTGHPFSLSIPKAQGSSSGAKKCQLLFFLYDKGNSIGAELKKKLTWNPKTGIPFFLSFSLTFGADAE